MRPAGFFASFRLRLFFFLFFVFFLFQLIRHRFMIRIQFAKRDKFHFFLVFDLGLFLKQVHARDPVIVPFVRHMGIDLWQPLFQFGILIVFITQTAHELAALAGKLGNIESKHLVFCHIDRDRIKVG